VDKTVFHESEQLSMTIKQTETGTKAATLNQGIVKGVSWMALFTYTTQALSWVVTIFVARLLSPHDYGLMGIATIFIGYADMLADMGLGSAIMQKKEINKDEISSVFWFSMGIGIIIALGCIPLSYLTAYVMHEPLVIPIVKVIGFVYFFSSMRIVPSSLLKRKLDFKSAAICESIGTVFSLAVVITAALLGAGVWALVFSQISRAIVSAVAFFIVSRWLPQFTFHFSNAKAFLNFGILLTLGRTFWYIQGKAGTFFAGRAWEPATLGLYTLAKELAQIPVDRITPLINNVCFPAFSKLQDDIEGIGLLYLRAIKITSLCMIPICIGGVCLGDLLISTVLGAKWEPMIFIFRLLCIAEIANGLNAINGFIHPASGHPKRNLFYQAICVLTIPTSFALAVPFGLNAIAFPALVTGTLLSVGWIIYTLHAFKIRFADYANHLKSAAISSAVMGLWILVFRLIGVDHFSKQQILIIAVATGSIVYCACAWLMERDFILKIISMARSRTL
jgi:O-antigen/teichoic acid export membrane protein